MSQPRPSNARPTRRASFKPQPQTKTPLDPNDAGVQRRAAKRATRQRNNWMAWSLLALATILISGALGALSGTDGVLSGASGIWREYQGVQQKVAAKEATLSDLRAQLERKQRRVGALDKREGKERALVEGGYLGEGERFLLFPKDKDKAKAHGE